MTLDRAAVAAAVRALDLEQLAARRWFINKGEGLSSLRLAHAFPLAADAVLALLDLRLGARHGTEGGGTEGDGTEGDGTEGEEADAGRVERYAIPFVLDSATGVLREALEGDGAWRALAAAMAEGRTIPAFIHDGPGPDGQPRAADAALVCRPAPGLAASWADPAEDGDLATDLFVDAVGGPAEDAATVGGATVGVADDPVALARAISRADERALGRDQSNTSVVLGERLLLKGYRRIQPGLNPDLELTAFLSEEVGFPGVPRLAGFAEVVTRDSGVATIAMLQVFVVGADDVYERTAELLSDLVGAPGSVSMEWATEVAEDLGTLIAGLHVALVTPPEDAPELAPRPATPDELRSWRQEVDRALAVAIAAVTVVDPETAAELRLQAATITARAARLEALGTVPLVMRVHADLHLGQLLVDEDGYRVIDFEGEPLGAIEVRRRLDSPMRDVASLLRSIDHVARSAARRAERRNGGPIERPGLDIDAWIERARERFLAAYAGGLRRGGAPFGLDLDLLDAFEVAKETYEFTYAATVLPSWLWAPTEGMRWLLARGGTA